MRLVYASRALRDIDGILERVHERSPKGAKNVSLAIEHTIAICAAGPYTGTKTDEPSLYRYPLAKYRYTIFYRVDADQDRVEIVRIVHGARVKSLGRLPADDRRSSQRTGSEFGRPGRDQQLPRRPFRQVR